MPPLRALLLCTVAVLLPAQDPPAKLLAAFDRMAARRLWPGFEPGRTPLAIFDGERTWLIRHPQPPAGFRAAAGGWRVLEGRHPAVSANSSAELGGTATATLMPAPGAAVEARAATLIHECFHVYQRLRHPNWSGNEAELFTYPVDDAEVLASRWQEEDELWNALRATRDRDTQVHAACALAARAARFQRIGPAAAAYERGSELNEGLATLVEYRALGRQAFTGDAPPRFGAEHLRDERFYAIGPAFGQLLDRLRPGWETDLESGKAASLDEALARATAGAEPAQNRAFDPRIRADAATAAAEVARDRQRALAAYLARPGWSVEVLAGVGAPLFPAQFDPWNVRRLSPDLLLHTRFLKLANASGSLEMIGRTGLTRAAGAHPLWNGVAAYQLCGLEEKPTLTELPDGTLRLSASGLTAEFRGWAAAWEGRKLILRPAAAPAIRK